VQGRKELEWRPTKVAGKSIALNSPRKAHKCIVMIKKKSFIVLVAVGGVVVAAAEKEIENVLEIAHKSGRSRSCSMPAKVVVVALVLSHYGRATGD
jgi:hypothetical protein